MTTQNTPPRWNMESLYSGIDSAEYRRALEDYEAQIGAMDVLLAAADALDADFADWLARCLDGRERLLALSGTLGAFAYVTYSTDTTSTAAMSCLAEVERLGDRASLQNVTFTRILQAHRNALEGFYARSPRNGRYRFQIEELLEDAGHLLPLPEEQLAADLSRTGGRAWGMLQEQIISNLHDAGGRTFNELRNDAYSASPQARQAAWRTERALLEQHRIALAASLNNLKGETITLNRRRRWASALERSLARSRLGRPALDALIATLEAALPVWRGYFQAKARLLRREGATASATAGTPGHEGLAFYDLFAPLPVQADGGLCARTWTFAQARDYVLAEYRSFSEDMYAFARRAFDEGWIDAEVRPGKVGGAYDEDFPKGHQSRILTNFTGAFSDIITLAHELGHAYHFSRLKGQPASFFQYPMTLAETASTFAETIVKQHLIAGGSPADRLAILDIDLQDASQVLVDILCRFYFERSVFEEREKGELNADDFCRLMRDAQERTYGAGLNEERHEYMWAVKSHYYSTDLDFYNFPYAFGQLFAAALYMKGAQAGASFAGAYADMLADTGRMGCEELCARQGFDITSTEFWQAGMDMYAREAELFREAAR